MYYVCIVFDLRVFIDKLRLLNASTELQQWGFFALVTSYKASRTAINNVTVLGSRIKYPILVPYFTKSGILRQIF
jgi:hypothetical protein